MHSVPASAFTSDEWANNAFDSQGEWYDFHVWANGENSYTGHEKESVEINIDSGTLTGDSQYNDIRGSVIGFVNMYAGDPRGTYRAPDVVINAVGSDKTLKLSMDNNPHAGILVSRTTFNYYTDDDTWSGNPSLTIRGNVAITGNVGGQVATDLGDFTAGVGLGLGKLTVDGDLSIALSGMNSQDPSERTNVFPDYSEQPWSQYYGWTIFDGQLAHTDNFNNSYLLQAGIAGGYSMTTVNGDLSVEVSGRNGMLAGVLIAGNDGYFSADGQPYIDGDFGMRVAGDAYIHAAPEASQKTYGIVGLGFANGPQDQSQPATGSIEIGGDLTVIVDGNGTDAHSMPQYGQDRYTPYLASGAVTGVYIGDGELHTGTDLENNPDSTGKLSIQISDVGTASTVHGLYLYGVVGTDFIDVPGGIEISIDAPSEDIDAVYGYRCAPTANYNSTHISSLSVNISSGAGTIRAFDSMAPTQYIGSANLSVTGGENTTEAYAVYQRSGGIWRYGSFWNWDYRFFDDYGITLPNLIMKDEAAVAGVTDGQGRLNIIGNVEFETTTDEIGAETVDIAYKSYIWMNFANGGYFKGAANINILENLTDSEYQTALDEHALGTLWLRFAGAETRWDLTGSSQASTLVLEDSAQIALGSSSDTTIGTVLDIRDFSGTAVDDPSAGSFRLNLDLSSDSYAVQGGLIAFVGEVNQDKPFAYLEITGTGEQAGAVTRPLVLDSTDSHNLQLALKPNADGETTGVEIGAYLYNLVSAVDEDGSYAEELKQYFGDDYFAEAGDTVWFLENTSEVNPTTNDVVSITGAASQVSAYLSHLTTLRDRMGDIRWTGENGLWARTSASKDRISGAGGTDYDNKTFAGYFGYDRTVGSWTIGADIRMAASDYEAHGLTRAAGDSDAVGGALYAAWHEGDAYLDLVLALDRYSESIKGAMLDGVTSYRADYDVWGWGASVEIGKAWRFGADKAWFVEPSAQLSYYRVEGADFTLTNGLKIEQGDADSLTGRLGVTAGHAWIDENGAPTGSVYVTTGINHEFKGDQRIAANDAVFEDDLLGTRVYYGLGVTKNLSGNVSLWAQIKREEGSDYTREYEGNAGVRWSF